MISINYLAPKPRLIDFVYMLPYMLTSFEVPLLSNFPERENDSLIVFFLDKYYRVDLRTKRVDPAIPPFPRSIAKYWLGCSDTTGAEK